MKYLIHLLLIALCFIPACAIFHETPAPVKEAAAYACKIAEANANNLQVINTQYYEAWLAFMKTHGATDEEMLQLTALFMKITKITEPLGRYGVELNRAIVEYLNTSGANLEKLIQTLSLVKDLLNGR